MDTFELTVPYKGTEYTFTGRLLLLGYIHKIEIDVAGTPVFFEQDEEGSYRAIVHELDRNRIDTALLQAIATVIENTLQ